MDILWAGWRSEYVRTAEHLDDAGCLFCRLPTEPDDEALVLERTERAFSVLNRFPYTSGHLMVAPYRHVATPKDLDHGERLAIWDLIARCQRALEAAMSPAGFNLGANVGKVAGAGVPGHFHMHLVPRWAGDTNFMSSVGGTRVVPEALEDTWERLRAALSTIGDDAD